MADKSGPSKDRKPSVEDRKGLSGMNLYFAAASFASPSDNFFFAIVPFLAQSTQKAYPNPILLSFSSVKNRVARPPRNPSNLPQGPLDVPFPSAQGCAASARPRRPDAQVQAHHPRATRKAPTPQGREAGHLQKGKEPGPCAGPRPSLCR